jgi:VanZ family protein
LLLFIPGIVWLILIYILLTIPGTDLPQSGFLDNIHFDKVVHIGLFAVLVFLFSLPFKTNMGSNKNVFVFISFAAFTYGTLMEYVQKYWVDNRTFDVSDIIADGLGCLVGYLYLRFRLRKVDLT